MTKEDIKKYVMEPIFSKGYKVYFVGGCVRDSLFGEEPHDYDLVTDATPEQLHTIFDKFSEQNSEPFGVTIPVIKNELIEIATMRKDITKGRHPKIEYTTSLEEDAFRRDFTVNALYEDRSGNVIDPTNGVKDLFKRELKFVGDPVERIAEDPLRVFRFCRFQAQKGLKPSLTEEQMNEIIKKVSEPNFYSEVSKERMLKEFIGILGGNYFMKEEDLTLNYMRLFKVTDALGLEKIFEDMENTSQNPAWHSEGSVYNHTVLVMREMAKEKHDWIDMLGTMLHDIGKPISASRKEKKREQDFWYQVKDHPVTGAPAAELFCKNLKMSNNDVKIIKELVLLHMDMHKLSNVTSKYKKLKLYTNPIFDRLVKLCRSDSNGSRPILPDKWEDIDTIIKKDKELIGISMPEPIVTGNDLIEAGIKPSEFFKKALEVAHKVQVDQNITDKKVLLNNVLKIAKGK